MKTIFKLAGAFIGLIVGVGFASGQEVLQFFASHGGYGYFAAIIAAALFSLMTMTLFQIGCRMQTKSHKEAIRYICGERLGSVVDLVLTVFLFCCIVLMLAGAGASFEQQLGMPNLLGSLLIAVAAIATVCLGLNRVITLMSWITPVLIPILIGLAVYAYQTSNIGPAELDSLLQTQPKAIENWMLSALLYVSSNIAGTAPVLIIMGASTKDVRSARMGGVLGGILIGALMSIMIFVLLAKLNVINHAPIPTLALITEVSPILGNIMLGLLMIKLYATTSGLAYALTARFEAYGIKRHWAAILTVGVALSFTFIGFVSLVGMLLTFMGSVGLLLMACIAFTWFRNAVDKQPVHQR